MSGVNLSPVPAVLTAAAINFAASGDNTVIAAGGATQIIRVYRIFFVSAGTTNITFKSGASVLLSGAMPFAANGSLTFSMEGEPWFTCGAGQAFVINNSAAIQISGTVYSTLGL